MAFTYNETSEKKWQPKKCLCDAICKDGISSRYPLDASVLFPFLRAPQPRWIFFRGPVVFVVHLWIRSKAKKRNVHFRDNPKISSYTRRRQKTRLGDPHTYCTVSFSSHTYVHTLTDIMDRNGTFSRLNIVLIPTNRGVG